MDDPIVRASVCRVAPRLDPTRVETRPRETWETGDYVVGFVEDGGSDGAMIELESGRMIHVQRRDRVVGAFTIRHATLEATGSWRSIEPDGRFVAMTAAGTFGRITSESPYVPRFVQLRYLGHCVTQEGDKHTMRRSVELPPATPFSTPTILVVGSSMSAGKTATCRVLVRRLRHMGLRVVAAKLTGCGRYRDALSMADAGAHWHYDFMDAGLPSTIGPAEEVGAALGGLLTRIQAHAADVAVVEAGASPLEPYNGQAAIQLLDESIVLTILCASDPYAVMGIRQAFDRPFDLVAGPTANTTAGVALVSRLTGMRAVNLVDPAEHPALDSLLRRTLSSAPERSTP
ncbi:MAG: hypothetical protein KTR31_29590 [Myxococcales bacterium]|nr:hypothetical protein [Myxococcales bacterium]